MSPQPPAQKDDASGKVERRRENKENEGSSGKQRYFDE